jgi:FkbM family methyltransferase
MTTIVIDVGCATHGGDESINYLIEQFSPANLFGFDPATRCSLEKRDNTVVALLPWAAWTFDGELPFAVDGLRGRQDPDGTPVRCFDLADFVRAMGSRDDLVLKLDAEGAEYVLLNHLIDRGVDTLLKLAWVEWHCPQCGTGWFTAADHCDRCGLTEPGLRTELEARMACDMHQWNR